MLTELSTIVGSLYIDLLGNKDKLTTLLESADSWLNNHATTTVNKEDAHKLCQALYTMLTCLNLKIADLSGFERRLAGEALTKASTGINQLLNSLESTAQTLEAQLAEKTAAEQGKIKSMQDHFNDRYLAIISKEDEGHPQRLTKLKEAAIGVNLDINQLLSKQQELTQLEETQKALQTLLRAANENDTRTRGRLYFADFVTANKTQFDILLKNLPEDKKEQFDNDIKAIINPTTTQSTTAAILGVMSWLTSPATLVARAVTPQLIQDSLNAVIPDTQDSYCKTKLKTLTQETLATIDAQMKTRQQEIDDLQEKLASGNEVLQKLIEKSEPQALQDIVTANTATIELAEESLKIIAPIKQLGSKLKAIEHLDTHITSFIQENDNRFKKFCDFFVRFGAWFSSPSLSKKITEAQQLKTELDKMQKANQQELEEHMRKFNADPEISDPIKVRLKQQLEDHSGSELSLPPTKSSTEHLHPMFRG